MKWNNEQLNAINLTNQNIVVSASAGAGKTTVLIARLIKRIVEDGVQMNEVLAMTFTEAAASEMKKRLLQALSDQITQPHLDQAKRDYAQKQLSLAENAHISTIHSFCNSIIKNHYAAIGLNPNRLSHIASESDVEGYKDRAFEDVLNIALNESFDDTLHLLKTLGSGLGNTDNLKQALFDIIYKSYNQVDQMAWFDQIEATLHPLSSLDEFDQKTKDFLFNHLNSHLQKCLYILDNNLALASEKYIEPIKETIDLLLKAKASLPHYQQAFDYIKQAGNIPHSYRKPSSKSYNDQFKTLAGFLKDEALFVKEFNSTQKPLKLAHKLAKSLLTQYEYYKAKDEKLDFNDLEHLAYKILCANNYSLSHHYQATFKEVMVDEFQDTNYIQNAIVELVAKPTCTFRVGDIKQSIYRFRGAQPSIMQNLLADDSITKIYLANNYRSKKRIVDFNNSLFSTLMNVEGLSVNYKKIDHQIADLPHQLVDNEDVVLDLLVTSEIQEDQKEEPKAASELKSHYIAQSILANMKTTAYSHFKDYCILVASHRAKGDLKKAFDTYNIPYFIDDKRGFIRSFSIRILYSYIKYLANPSDIISLYAVLTSPLYNLSEADLYLLKENLLSKLAQSNHPFIDDLSYLRSLFSIPEMINYILKINSFYEDHINLQEKTNVDLFYQLALEDDTFTLASFVDYIELILPKNKDSAIPISDDDDIVKVMTIHQSKGLQFNVVYLYSQISFKKPVSSRLVVDDIGLALPYTHPLFPLYTNTLNELSLKHTSKALDAEENLRLLYVALTRAKERLHIVDCIDPKNEYTLSYEDILKPLGFTPLILSSIRYFQEGYFCNYVDKEWVTLNHNTLVKDLVPLLHYSKPIMSYNAVKPSDHDTFEIKLNLTDVDFASIGTTLHKTIESLPHSYPLTDEVIFKANPDLEVIHYNSLYQLYENDLYRATFDYENYHEYEFSYLKDNQIIHGFIDYIAFMDEIVIIDFKSDRHVSEEDLKERYSSQLVQYKQVIQSIFNNYNVVAYIYSLTLNKMIVI